jgi:uncharacterized protein involved in exopolysaccharide biosynthesis
VDDPGAGDVEGVVAGSDLSGEGVSASECLAAISRAYQQLQALPGDEGQRIRNGDPTYLRLEAEIRSLAEQYKILTTRVHQSQYSGGP